MPPTPTPPAAGSEFRLSWIDHPALPAHGLGLCRCPGSRDGVRVPPSLLEQDLGHLAGLGISSVVSLIDADECQLIGVGRWRRKRWRQASTGVTFRLPTAPCRSLIRPLPSSSCLRICPPCWIRARGLPSIAGPALAAADCLLQHCWSGAVSQRMRPSPQYVAAARARSRQMVRKDIYAALPDCTPEIVSLRLWVWSCG